MKRRVPHAQAIFFAVMLLSGCRNADPPAVNEAVPAENPTKAEIAIVAEPPLQLASWDEVEQLIAAEEGKVVVVDVWSTWCTPCVREFPHLVALHKKHEGKVACFSLNCNYTGAEDESPEDFREEIASFLKSQEATCTNVISTTPDETLLETFGAASIPVIRVYDRQGSLRKQFTNDEGEYGDEGFTYAQNIEPLVNELLSE